MIQVISEKRRPSMGEKFSSAIGTALPQLQQLYDQKQEEKALEGMGLGHLKGLSPELKKIGFQEQLKGQNKQKQDKTEEKRRGYEVGLGTIQNMKTLLPKLGPWQSVASPIDSMGARQAYTTYANSLLGILSTIPVRNQKEFDAVREALSSPMQPQEKIKNAIESAEDILTRHLESLESGREFDRGEKEKSSKKVKFNPNNSEHAAKYNQLIKKYGEGSPKVNEILAKEFTG